MSSNDSINDADETAHWELTIRPSRSLLHLDLAELWRYRDLLTLFVHRDLVSFYKQTILGPVWFFVQPLLTAITYYIIFGKIAELPTDGVPPFLFYLSGITFWNYFSESFLKTSETFVGHSQLFGKVYFPRLIIPLSIIVSNLFRFSIQLCLLLIVWGYYFFTGIIAPTSAILFLPIAVVLMATLGLGIGLIFSAVTTKYRDLRFLIQFGIQLLMYATPIIYPLSIADGRYRQWISVNPLAPLFEAIRVGLLGAGEWSWLGLLWTTIFSIGCLGIGVLFFNYTERNVIDTI